MSGRERRDRDRDRRPSDRRDAQPDDEPQRRPGEAQVQEADSLTALKAILGKVAALLTSLQLTQDESISLVEQLYGSVLDMDVKLAGETDDKRKSSILAHIQDTAITRSNGKLMVEYPEEASKPAAPSGGERKPAESEAPAEQPEAQAPPAVAPKRSGAQATAASAPEQATLPLEPAATVPEPAPAAPGPAPSGTVDAAEASADV
jgi:hypothetical protein